MSSSRRELFLRLAVIVFGVAALILSGLTVASADTYTYDAYGRLTGVTYSDGSSISYTYDAAGNRTASSGTP
jgi:YD repeat-containing protein